MTDQTQTMLVTVAVWVAVALLVVWADARRAGAPLFSGPRWQLVQIPVWIWLAGGVFAGARLWWGMWLLYGMLGPVMALVVGVVWWRVRRTRPAGASTARTSSRT